MLPFVAQREAADLHSALHPGQEVPPETVTLMMAQIPFFSAYLLAQQNDVQRQAFCLNLNSALAKSTILKPWKRIVAPTAKQIQRNVLFQMNTHALGKRAHRWKADWSHVAQLIAAIAWQRRFGYYEAADSPWMQHIVHLLQDRAACVIAEHVFRLSEPFSLLLEAYSGLDRTWKECVKEMQKTFIANRHGHSKHDITGLPYTPYATTLLRMPGAHVLPVFERDPSCALVLLEAKITDKRGVGLEQEAVYLLHRDCMVRWRAAIQIIERLLQLQQKPALYAIASVNYDLEAFLTIATMQMRDKYLRNALLRVVRDRVGESTVTLCMKETTLLPRILKQGQFPTL